MLSIFITLLFVGTSTWLGFELTFFVTQGRLKFLEIFSVSFPIGMIIVSLSCSFLNLFFFCTFVHFIVQVILSIIISVVLMKYNRRNKIDYSSISIGSLLGIIMWSIIFCYLSTYIFPNKDRIIQSGDNDMLLEISMVSSFIKGVNKKSNIFTSFQINILKGLTTRTEILPFLYLSLIRASGCSLRLSIIILTMFLFISICFLSYSYIYRITNNRFISFFAAPTMLLIGGLGFTHFVNNNERNNGGIDFIFYYGSEINNWGHPLLHNFLTSRINLTSLSLSLITYLFLESGFYHLAGIGSIFSFFVRPQSGFILFIAFFLYNIDFDEFKCKRNHRRNTNNTLFNRLKYYLIPFLILSFLLLRSFSIEFQNPLWSKGHSRKSFIPFLAFPYNVYGFGFISLFITLLYSPYRVFLSMFLFYFLSIVNLQNEHRFNFFTAQTVVTPLIVAGVCSGFSSLLRMWTNPEIKGITATIILFLFILMWLSSFCGLYNQIGRSIQIFGEDINDAAKWIAEKTKRNSVFAMPQSLSWNPAFTRAGRVGYVGNTQALQDFNVNTSIFYQKLTNFIQKPDHRIDVDYFIFKKDTDNWKNSLTNSKILDVVFNNTNFIIMSWNSSNN